MTIRLGDISGGGSFVPYTGITTTTVAAGASGDIFNITPAVGNVLRVIRLSTNTSTAETGMTVTITNNSGPTNILSGGDLADLTPGTFDFYIGRYSISSMNSIGGLDFVDCKNITVTKDTGNTVQGIVISYVEGRFES